MMRYGLRWSASSHGGNIRYCLRSRLLLGRRRPHSTCCRRGCFGGKMQLLAPPPLRLASTFVVYIVYWDFLPLHRTGDLEHLIYIQPVCRILFQHLGYQQLQLIREQWIGRKFKACIQDSHLAALFERRCIVTQLVEKHSERPDIALLVNRLFPIDINHFWASILQGGMSSDVIVDTLTFCSIGCGWSGGGRRTKVTQLIRS